MFAISYLVVEIIDGCNFIITQTMIFKKMKADSRGTIIAIEAVMIATSIVVTSQIINGIQSSHEVKNGGDGGDGSYQCYFTYFLILVCYWLWVLTYTAIDYCRGKNQDQNQI